MNEAREKLSELIYEHTKFSWTESEILSSFLLTAIKEDKVPGVGVCEGCQPSTEKRFPPSKPMVAGLCRKCKCDPCLCYVV